MFFLFAEMGRLKIKFNHTLSCKENVCLWFLITYQVFRKLVELPYIGLFSTVQYEDPPPRAQWSNVYKTHFSHTLNTM